MADVFISHALADRVAASRLERALKARGLSVFRAPTLWAGLRPQDRWHARLYDELDQAHAVVALFSYKAAARPWIIAEASIADFQGKLLSISLEPRATPGPLADTEFTTLLEQDLAPRFGFFGEAPADSEIDRLVQAVREKQAEAQAFRARAAERLQAAPAVATSTPEQLADTLPFGFGAAPGDPTIEQRRAGFVAAVRSLEQASNPDLANAARALLANGQRADSVARLYAAVSREQQPLVWRRFGEAALPQGVYAALAGLERAGLSPRQINERIAPQTTNGLLRARFGDRLFDAIGGFAFAALIAVFLGVGAGQIFGRGPAETSVARIPPMEEVTTADAASASGAWPQDLPRNLPRAGPAAPSSTSAPAPTPPVAAPPAQAPAAAPQVATVTPPPRAPVVTASPPPAPVARASLERTPAPRTVAQATPRPATQSLTVIPSGPSGPCPGGVLTGAATYTVQPGDVLWQVANKCYGDPYAWRAIAQCNPMLVQRNLGGVSPLFGGDLLYVGDRLILPGPGGSCPA
ncbi:MAG: TIR domain-containing protein [Caulobacterales bacterium]